MRSLFLFTFLHFFLISSTQSGAVNGFSKLCEGSLSFLTLHNKVNLPCSDDGYSSQIYTRSALIFGGGRVYSVYVSTNGYISMGTLPSTSSPSIPGTNNIVSPYGADIDTTRTGNVSYSPFSSTTSGQLSTVNSYIRSQTDSSFHGNSMMIAEWNGVAQYKGNASVTSTFQAVLITDGSISYAVFIYECGGMEWGGAAIGWAATSIHEEHSLSESSSASIGNCDNSSVYKTIVYTISKLCADDQFTCDNGECKSSTDVCDGYYDCSDDSDEENCGSSSSHNIGWVIVAGVTLFFVICLVVVICIITCKHCPRRINPLLRGYTVTTNASDPTVTTSDTALSLQTTTVPPPLQLTDAQFSSGVAPPSYNDAVSYPSLHTAADNTPPPQATAPYNSPPPAYLPPTPYSSYTNYYSPPTVQAYPPPGTQSHNTPPPTTTESTT